MTIKCPVCNASMEYDYIYDGEHREDNYITEAILKCPKCNHYTRVKLTYTVTNIKILWE